MNSTIALYNQTKLFDILNPDPALITVHNIGSALSKICRFGGQIGPFYSVAEHSVLVLKLARAMDLNLKTQKAALLHDAAEAYIGDLTTPVKSFAPEIKQIEIVLMSAIYEKFEVFPFIQDESLRGAVKFADNLAFYLEAQEFFGNVPWVKSRKPKGEINGVNADSISEIGRGIIHCHSPIIAFSEFQAACYELGIF